MSDPLSISASAVTVYQRVLGTVSNNIANVGTEGYVRQEASVAQTAPSYDGRVYRGTGAVFNGVTRQYSKFIESTLRRSTAELSMQETLVNYANRVIDILGSEQVGLSPAMDRFFASARALAAEPASAVARQSFLRDADGAASRFRELSSQLKALNIETQDSVNSQIGEINTLAAQLAQVNTELAKEVTLSRQPPALLDQRDNLLRDLSALVNINIEEFESGMVDVRIGGQGGSASLVVGQRALPLMAKFDPRSWASVDLIVDPYGEAPESVGSAGGGSLGGLLAFRAQMMEPAQGQLDSLAKLLAQEANQIHRAGVDGYGEAGGDLFSFEPEFSISRLVGQSPLQITPKLTDPDVFVGANIDLIFDQDAGQVSTVSFAGPFKKNDRIEIELNGSKRILTLTADASAAEGMQQLQQFVDGSFGTQLRASIDGTGRLMVTSARGESFRFDVGVASDTSSVQLENSQGLWTTTDPVSGQTISGASSLTVRGITVQIKGTPADGEALTIEVGQRPGAALQMRLTDPLRVAAAGPFRASSDPGNLGTASPLLGTSDPVEFRSAPVLGSARGLPNNPVASAARIWDSPPSTPIAVVAAGQKNVALMLDLGTSDIASARSLQVFTREGRHLLGNLFSLPVGGGENFVESVQRESFVPGSQYSDTYLNQTGTNTYRDLEIFYGAKAYSRELPVLGTDHVVSEIKTIPARLQADYAPPTAYANTPAIASGALTLNGVSLSGVTLSGTATQRAQQIVSWLNNHTATTGVKASINDGAVELNIDDSIVASDSDIEFGFGSSPDPRLLAALGFRSGVYVNGTVPEELVVFGTGSGPIALAAEFEGAPYTADQARQAQRISPFDIEFVSDSEYIITDLNTGSEMARRTHTVGEPINFNGLAMSFTTIPRSGDVFHVDGNQDGLGDNRTALLIADLENAQLTGAGGNRTISESYLDSVDQISNVTKQAQISKMALEVVKKQATDAREGVSGVSLDEEAANLIRFQQAYQAAAKSMQTANQLFEALLRV